MRRGGVFVGSLTTTACFVLLAALPATATPEPPGQPANAASGNSSPAEVAEFPATATAPVLPDRDQAKLTAGAGVPGFAGSYLTEASGRTELHVLATEPRLVAPSVDGALASLVGELKVDEVVVEPARYTFSELKGWQTSLTNAIGGGVVVMTDVDERSNSITVGVKDSALAEDARQLAVGLGLPSDAVKVVEFDVRPMNLDQAHRPMVGGTQISWQTGAFTTRLCTYGFNAARAGIATFVTNSHCSRTQGTVDDGRYWQANRPVLGDQQVGTEIVDPGYFSGGTCPSGSVCRRSDANVVRIHDGVTSTRGRIARPASQGTLTWNGTSTWRVVAADFTYETRAVRAVGRTSGMSTGTVSEVCANIGVELTNIVMLCQDYGTWSSQPGDSGSPVFEAINTPATYDVRLVGINWGGGEIDGVPIGILSPFPYVENELGALTVCATGFSC